MGQAVITINGFSYTILLNADYTFCIKSEASFRRKLPHIGSERKAEYNYYREMLGAMGTIAYEIQSQFHIVPQMGSEQNAYTYSQQGVGQSRMNQSGMGAQTQGFSNQGGPTPGCNHNGQKEIGQDVLITLDGVQLQIKKPIGWQLPAAS